MTSSEPIQTVDVIDSHTGGEPTRLVIGGGPDLGNGPLSERLERFRKDHDAFRSAVVNEPRGGDVWVGGLLCEPADSTCAAGVIFFNNVGYLGMCGHGTMGLIRTLAHLGRLEPGTCRIETPVGIVEAELEPSGCIAVQNVPSYRSQANVRIEVEGCGPMHGDVAWGGNWFFLCEDHGLAIELGNVEELTRCAWAIRRQLAAEKIAGTGGAEIDHIELFGPGTDGKSDSRNFVLCPGGAYDRSPCGTGTSAKAACLFAEGKIRPGQVWRQESIVGSLFEVSVEEAGEDRVLPTVRGTAHLTAESKLLIDPADPLAMGLGS